MRLLIIALALFASWEVKALPGSPPVRVALVSDAATGEVVKVLDLATVKLGRNKDIELLDRAAIERLLEEQKLSLAGTLDPNAVVNAGRLLAVDMFAVIDTVAPADEPAETAGRTVAGLVVFDARTGVRLWDATPSADGIENLAEAVVNGVLLAQRKRVVAGLPMVCLVSVRNADLPRSLDGLCSSVGLLLERRLMASSKCTVLERQRLEFVNQERELPGKPGRQQLLASLVMVELECSRVPDGGGMRVRARLTDVNGHALAEPSVTNQSVNADALAAGLCQKIQAVLKLDSGPAAGDRQREGQRFRGEAKLFLAHGDLAQGLAGLEAAFALIPDASKLRRDLGEALIRYAGIQTNLLHALRIVRRGTELLWEHAQKARGKASPAGNLAAYDFVYHFLPLNVYLRNFNGDAFRNAGYLSAAEMQEARSLLRDIYERHRAFDMELAMPALFEAVLNRPGGDEAETADLFEGYGMLMLIRFRTLENLAAFYPDDWSQDWLSFLKNYLRLLEQAPLAEHPRRIAAARRVLNSMVLNENAWWNPTHWRQANPADQEEARRLMESHPCPFVRAYGMLKQLDAARDKTAPNTQPLPPVGEAYRLYLENCLTDPAQSAKPSARRLFYEAAAGHLGDADTVTFCDFMLRQNDLHPDTLSRATSWLSSQSDGKHRHEAVEFYVRAMAILQKENGRYLGNADAKQYLPDLAKEREIAQQKADDIALPPLPAAWREVRQLVDLGDAKAGLIRMFRPVIYGNFVYAAGLGIGDTNSQFLQLLRISLSKGTVEPLSKITVSNVDPQAACMDGNNYYLGTKQGVFVFPKSGGPAGRITHLNGLPSDEVTAMDCLGGTLYLGLGEAGYLVGYDLKTGRCETLGSGRRRERLSPFDNGWPLAIPVIVADEPKRRIVFLADQLRGSGNWKELLQTAQETKEDVFTLICKKARAGMWSYHPQTREFKTIFPRHPSPYGNHNDATWIGRVSDTQIMMSCAFGQKGAALYDHATDTPTLLYGSCGAIGLEPGMAVEVRRWQLPVNPALVFPPMLNHSLELRSASFLHAGWVWSSSPFRRFSTDSLRSQDLPSLRPGDESFAPSECFRLVATNQALIGDQRGLWLVAFSDNNAHTNTVAQNTRTIQRNDPPRLSNSQK
jgi:hypothetical protein